MEKAKSVVDYYILCNKLKNTIRTGWKTWKVKRQRIESVAEHIFGVQNLAIAMYSQYEYDLDIYKVIFMLAIHELEEIGIGDLTDWDISREDRLKNGHSAVSSILKDLLKKDEIESLILEFDERKTKEAIFAYHCDKLEAGIQSKVYDEENCVDLNDQNDNPINFDPKVQKIFKDGEKSWSNMWLEFDRDKYADDQNFIELLEYLKNNNIMNKKDK